MVKVFFFILLSLTMYAGSACAEVKDFVSYSVDVPHAWRIQQEEVSVSLLQDNAQCGIDIVVAPHQNVNFRELCIFFYERLRGKGAKGDDDGFTFTSQNDYGIPSMVRLTLQEDHFFVVTASGSCPELRGVVESIQAKVQGPRLWPLLPAEYTQATLPRRQPSSDSPPTTP